MRLGALSAMAAGGTLVHPAEAATLVTEDGLVVLLLRLAAEDEQMHRLVGKSRHQWPVLRARRRG
jgi:hypothetical protein